MGPGQGRQALRLFEGQVRNHQPGGAGGCSLCKKAFRPSIQKWIAVSEEDHRDGEPGLEAGQHLKHTRRCGPGVEGALGRGLNHRAVSQRIAVGNAQFHHVGAIGLKAEQNIGSGGQIRIPSHQKGHQCHLSLLLKARET